MNHSKGLLALSPIAVFLAVYLGSSLIASDFYSTPVWAAFLIACIYAFCIFGGSLKSKLRLFYGGAADKSVLQMVGIFILAGAFAGSAKGMGAVDATVGAALSIIPGNMLLTGLFITACFISMAVGTSVGTIVALAPVGAGIASSTGIGIPFITALIVGGAFFGDNLSFISDTTIAATRSQNVSMDTKFKENIKIVLPAVLAVAVIYTFKGWNLDTSATAGTEFNWVRIVPYLLIIVMGISGVNVLISLVTGLLSSLIIGGCTGAYTSVADCISNMASGISSMTDLIIVTLLAGGLLALIRENKGLEYIMSEISSRVNGRRGAAFSIAAIVSMANLCTANNTIAIITSGGLAHDISTRFRLSPGKTASILDTFSCLCQGLIPYGAQLLIASDLTGTTPLEIIPFLYYPMLMGICALTGIVLIKD